MKDILKHKNKIIVGVLIIILLGFVFWWGGNAPSLRGFSTTEAPETIQPEASAPITAETPTPSPNKSAVPQQTTPPQYDTHQSTQQPTNQPTAHTEQAAEPTPEALQAEESDTAELTCTLSVRCDAILKRQDWLNEEKREIIPADGIIFEQKEVVFFEGESVFNVLLRELKKNKIHLEFVNTPIYNSAYIEGIANLYEFDCGELSGWMYKVNGTFPNYGCSRYFLKPGDRVEWVYTCDGGKDVGGGVWQKDE